jgi:circadian clock protein KaiC
MKKLTRERVVPMIADFRESLYRMIFALTEIGVTILSTVEVDEFFTEFPFSTYSISFLTDDIIRLRYVSIDGQLRKIMVVIKMRGGNHAKDIREYEITSKGVVILGKRLPNYQGLISGIPIHSDRRTSRKNLRWIRESSIKPNGTLTAFSRQK